MPGDADDAGQRRRQRAEPGEELGDQQRARAAPREDGLGPPHARVRLQRDPTEPAEDPTATPAPELVPDDVSRQRGHQRHAERQRHAHLPGAGQRPDAEQDRHRGDRQPDLLGRDEREQDHVTVLDDEREEIAHVATWTV